MRLVLFFVLLLTYTLNLQAQQEWVDYIVGRPDVFYLESKRAEASHWGIAYRSETAGCIDCEDTRLRAQELNALNQQYFNVLEMRYGEDWLEQFNKAVAKRHSYALAQENQNQGIWYEWMVEQGDSEYYDTKKAVAAEWGIAYQAVFVKDNLSEAEKAVFQEQAAQSYTYELRLQNRLGEQWKDWIDEATRTRLKQQLTPQSGIWTDVVWGTPNTPYYQAKTAVAKRWGIQYKTQYMGNDRQADLVQQQRALLQKNAVYFATLNRHFKSPWLAAFHREVQQVYAQILQEQSLKK